MPVIAIINRKGGSGKSTIAAHLAAKLARDGKAVMLGDVDRQQSTRAWLKRRNPALPTIAPWVIDQKNVLRVPPGITHVVLDTPGGLHGFDLARIVMFADAIIMPVCNSPFDRESAEGCHAELMTLPRVASGKCKLAAIGMRIDSRTRGAEALGSWAEGLGLKFLGALRDTLLYVQCLERGLTLFDLSPSKSAIDLPQWQPVFDWLLPVVDPAQATAQAESAASSATGRIASSLSDSLVPAQASMVHGERLTASQSGRTPAPTPPARPAPTLATGTHGGRAIPSFLRRVQ